MESQTLRVKRLTKTAIIPTRGSELSAGYDLYADENVFIKCQSQNIISTGIAVELPKGMYGSIRSRSGLACTEGVHAEAGVIDEDYRGEIKVLLSYRPAADNQKVRYIVMKGDKIAQMIVSPYVAYPIIEIEDLSDTKRGDRGFGSTGK